MEKRTSTQVAKALVTLAIYLTIYYCLNVGYYKTIRPAVLSISNYQKSYVKNMEESYKKAGLELEIDKNAINETDKKVNNFLTVLDKAMLIKPNSNGKISYLNVFDKNYNVNFYSQINIAKK